MVTLVTLVALVSLVGCASVPRRLARGRVEEACELASGATASDRQAWSRHVGTTRVAVEVDPLGPEELEARFGLLPRGEGSRLLHVRWAVDGLPEGATRTELTLRLSALGQTAGALLTSGVGGDLREVFAPPRLAIEELAPYEPAPFDAPPRPELERRGTPGRPHPVERLANDLLAAFSLGAFRRDDEALPPLTPKSSRALGAWLEEVRQARARYDQEEASRRAAYDARRQAAAEANEAAEAAHALALEAHHDALDALSVELAIPRCEPHDHGTRCEGWTVWSAPPTDPEGVAIWAHVDLGFGACTWHLVGHVLGEPGASWDEALANVAPEPKAIELGSVY
ncbi:MAG: hypothetical protein H6722_24510 [Sandaracinus sp.]|nr:hypothetical protein [Sandaracinus sp.]